jgi:hypothetical protein
VNVLVVGGGRMGQRHIAGLVGEAERISLVDPNPNARATCVSLARSADFAAFADLQSISGGPPFDLIILATPAAGRLEQMAWAAERTRRILAEKPLEQSRARTRELLAISRKPGLDVWCNHYRRALTGFEPLRAIGGPYVISVSSGAMGLGCNGIHWIDFALHLSGQASGQLLYGEIEDQPIGSGRGPQYHDYGGRGLFAFPDGSRLYLSSFGLSSAPTTMSIVTPSRHWLIDQQSDRSLLQERRMDAQHPTYLYGKDYHFEERTGLESVDLSMLTRALIRAVAVAQEPPQPRIERVVPAYELLFDLLETSGRTHFGFA